MRPGDIITEEPPIGSVVEDCDAIRHVRVAGGWCCCGRGEGCPTPSAWSTVRISDPLTLISIPEPAPAADEWEAVTADQVRVGDEAHLSCWMSGVEIDYRGRVTNVGRREQPSVAGRWFVELAGLIVIDEPIVRSIRRRVRPPMPEPAAPAVVRHAGRVLARGEHPMQDSWLILAGPKVFNRTWATWPELLALDPATDPVLVDLGAGA
jgi:hypothetical protein